MAKSCGQFEANLKSIAKYGVTISGDMVNYDYTDSELANAEAIVEELKRL